MPEPDRVQDGINEGVFEIVVAPSDATAFTWRSRVMCIGPITVASASAACLDPLPFPLAFDPNSEFRNDGPFMAVSPNKSGMSLFGTPAKGLWRSDDAGETGNASCQFPQEPISGRRRAFKVRVRLFGSREHRVAGYRG